jgi:Tfp pilus assembly protein PilF
VAHSIGELYLQSKKQSESLVHFELAYRSRLKALGIKHKDTLRSGNFYGQTLYQNKQNDESLAILKQVIEAHEQMFGPTDKQLVEMYQSLATVQMAKGDTQNAALSLQKSKDIASKQADPAVQS